MVHISEPLAQKLTQIAERDRQSLDEVVENLLAQQLAEMNSSVRPGTLAALIQAADQSDLASDSDYIAERSHEILNVAFDLFSVFSDNVIYNENIHSDILAFLLGGKRSPNAMRFTYHREFLEALLARLERLTIPANELNFEDVLIRREADITDINGKGRIDILVEIGLKQQDNKKFALIIENKINSYEHTNQLERYYEWGMQKYTNHCCFVFLSPKGVNASHEKYESVDYSRLAEILKDISTQTDNDTLLINLYTRLLKQISERLPKLQDILAKLIERLIKDTNQIENIVSENNTWVNFEPKGWNAIINSIWQKRFPEKELPEYGVWGFSFWLGQTHGVSIEFYFLMKDQLNSFYKQLLSEGQKAEIKGMMALDNPKPIGSGENKWVSIYQCEILSSKALEEKSKIYSQSPSQDMLTDLENNIKIEWGNCLDDIPKIQTILEVLRKNTP